MIYLVEFVSGSPVMVTQTAAGVDKVRLIHLTNSDLTRRL